MDPYQVGRAIAVHSSRFLFNGRVIQNGEDSIIWTGQIEPQKGMMPPKKVSIIIPSRNRPEQLATCVAGLAKQELPLEDLEIVVVDDGSSPKLDQRGLHLESKLDLKLFYQTNQGPAEARNAGARNATGQYLLFTDDDCIPDPGWATRLVEQLDQTPHQAVGGKTINTLKNNLFAEASQELNSYIYSYYNRNGVAPNFLASNNLGLTREDFFDVGGFSTRYTHHFSEDRDFCDKWRYSKRGMKYLPDAIVRHSHSMGFICFWRQHFDYGRGARQFHLERKLRKQPVPRIEPLSFYTNMLAHPYQAEKFIRATLIMLLIGLTQVAHTFGYLWQRFASARNNLRNE